MPFNILLIPLLSGYYLLTNFAFFKYRYQRLTFQRLLLHSALAGLVLSSIILALRVFIENYFYGVFVCLRDYTSFFNVTDARYLRTMTLGLLLTVSLVHLANYVIRLNPRLKDKPIRRAIKGYGNELEQLVLKSIDEGFALQLTLKNDKVYIGFVTDISEPGKTNYLQLVPFYSGYRHPRKKTLVLTTDYHDVVKSLIEDEQFSKLSILSIIIKQDEILTVSPHDPDVFSRFTA